MFVFFSSYVLSSIIALVAITTTYVYFYYLITSIRFDPFHSGPVRSETIVPSSSRLRECLATRRPVERYRLVDADDNDTSCLAIIDGSLVNKAALSQECTFHLLVNY